jgi:hypothetical protein
VNANVFLIAADVPGALDSVLTPFNAIRVHASAWLLPFHGTAVRLRFLLSARSPNVSIVICDASGDWSSE